LAFLRQRKVHFDFFLAFRRLRRPHLYELIY
jgi:hypothetical protein